MKIPKSIIILVLLVIGNSAWSQLDSILIRFNAFVEGNDIRLDWTIKGGYQCNGTVIQHSTDSLNFTNIGDIPGICGSPFYNEDYSFTHISPPTNTKNYYRIDLVGIGYSKIISRDNIDLHNSNTLVIPNPITSSGKILFNNPYFEECTIRFYSATGQHLFTRKTQGNRFNLDANQFPTGVIYYQFSIRDKHSTSSQFIIKK